MKYWKEFHREESGHYFAESDFTTEILHIYKLSKNLWGSCFDRGMTKKTFKTLREAKEHYGI